MSNFEKLSITAFSERGIDNGLHTGRFNALAGATDDDFESYWWREITLFEKILDEKFGAGAVFVSDNVPPGKRFGVEICGNAKVPDVLAFVLSHLESTHPDAAVVVGDVLNAPIPAARLILSPSGCALDQDAVAWFVNRAPAERVKFQNLPQLREDISSTNIVIAHHWLQEKGGVLMSPFEFWSSVYSGKPFVPMTNDQGEARQAFELGSDIIGKLVDCRLDLEIDASDFYLSHSLPGHRAVKIECSRGVFDERTFDKVIKMVTRMDRTWGCRFSIFESLDEPDSYLGGIIFTPGGKLILEGDPTKLK